MNDKQIIRWLGMICILAGIARIGMTPTSMIWGTDSPQELTFGFIACILMSVGTIVTYLVQARETGVTGFVATLAIIIANIVTTAMVWTPFVMGAGAPMPEGIVVDISRAVMMVGLMGGSLVFAILSFKARVFPRWVPALLVLMLLNLFLPIADNQFFAAFWGLAYVGMGYCIWAGKLNSPAARQAGSVTA
ncbi:hypothetical protein SAMN02799630_04229 [Paenibacillus sp. UNCCL117]|uniref:hypothetical protein n=1 Tax=unclassified Paenibacillus TaxID=185978 RepID=UPI000888A512|nr:MULTISPECIES: hypothetical protein [unclassified Paenibacillus]SDD83022.1 hypothetical protein SAMN04488602_11423 [Paenibacillus sp. cl123]SFW54982.1 hypothetical protein SAMN02799630_04229 [Paenibacillus sp. UNCCL117]